MNVNDEQTMSNESVSAADRQLLQEAATRFAREKIQPLAAELDRSASFPRDLYREMCGLGLFGVTVPQEYGGVGADCRTYAMVMEALAGGYAAVGDYFSLMELVSSLLAQHGTPEQRTNYLAPLLGGERLCAFALTEPQAGSDLAGISTTARRTGTGWVLNGSKLWIQNAPVCDFALVLARIDTPDDPKATGVFIVDADRKGFSRGPAEDKMGQRASQVGALYFDGIELPAHALLGTAGKGLRTMLGALDKGRVGMASLAVGIHQAALDAALEQALARRQFGRPIADFQAIQFMLADMAKDLHASRLLVQDAARRLDHREDASQYCSIAKCFATDAANLHVSNALQVFGGSGYIRGFPIERLFRDARITQIYEGTNQIQRIIIARKLMAGAATPA